MSSGKDSITVVVSALNEEQHLEGAVTTALEAVRHWFDEYEILVFNDGSTDGTGAVAERLSERDPVVEPRQAEAGSITSRLVRAQAGAGKREQEQTLSQSLGAATVKFVLPAPRRRIVCDGSPPGWPGR